MKNLITILCLCSFLFPSNQDETNIKIKKITKNVFDVTQKFGEDVETLSSKIISILDTSGNVIEESEYDGKGILVSKNISIYENNNLIENTKYDSLGLVVEKIISTFDSNNNRLNMSRYDSEGKLTWENVFNYDSNDNNTEMFSYTIKDGEVKVDTTTMKYDSNNNEIEINMGLMTIFSDYDSNNNRISMYMLGDYPNKDIYKYNSDNLMIESFTYYGSNDNLSKKTFFNYDYNNNKISEHKYKVGYKFGKNTDILTKKVLYNYEYHKEMECFIKEWGVPFRYTIKKLGDGKYVPVELQRWMVLTKNDGIYQLYQSKEVGTDFEWNGKYKILPNEDELWDLNDSKSSNYNDSYFEEVNNWKIIKVYSDESIRFCLNP